MSNTTEAASGDVLNSPPPAVDAAWAVAQARALYGLEVTAQVLACERDANFCLRDAAGRGYTMKVSNPAEATESIDFQTEALLWLERKDPSLLVPKVVRTLAGEAYRSVVLPDGRVGTTRLLTWLEGTPLARLPVSTALRLDLMRVLARIGAGFEGFAHAGGDADLLWDIKHAARLRPLIVDLTEVDLRAQLLAAPDRFERHVLPVLPDLRWRVIHNDLNLHNVVADPADGAHVGGVLDFGDMVRTPLIVDLAVGLSYHTGLEGDVMGEICAMTAAYHAVLPLARAEVLVLRDLVVARLVTTVAITEWRAAKYPENATYILRNNGPARQGLARFGAIDPEIMTSALLAACAME